MANESGKWSMSTGGKTYGPYTKEQLALFIREGRANAASQVCAEGGSQWMRLADALPDLFAGAPPPPIAAVAPKKGMSTGWITCLVLGAGCLIAVPFISIIAAIAIPSLLRSRLAANETSAIGSLRNFMSTEAAWRQNDMDGNGVPDYWTADVYGLYACADDTGKPTKAVDIALAKADRFPNTETGTSGKRPYYAVPVPAMPMAKAGFLFHALAKDQEGKPYALDGDGDGKACENPSRFGFRASPEVYGTTGVNAYQVNEDGVIYGRDTGGRALPMRANWEGRDDPTRGNPPWRVVQ